MDYLQKGTFAKLTDSQNMTFAKWITLQKGAFAK